MRNYVIYDKVIVFYVTAYLSYHIRSSLFVNNSFPLIIIVTFKILDKSTMIKYVRKTSGFYRGMQQFTKKVKAKKTFSQKDISQNR